MPSVRITLVNSECATLNLMVEAGASCIITVVAMKGNLRFCSWCPSESSSIDL